MSTIAYRNGVLCADRQAQNGDTRFEIKKLATEGDVAIAWVGVWVDGRKFADWYFKGADLADLPEFHGKSEDPEFTALVMTSKGCEEWTPKFVPIPVGEFTAAGSGEQAAMAALYMGADAKTAVEMAHKTDIHTGAEIDEARSAKLEPFQVVSRQT